MKMGTLWRELRLAAGVCLLDYALRILPEGKESEVLHEAVGDALVRANIISALEGERG